MEPKQLAEVQAKLDALKVDYEMKLVKRNQAEQETDAAWRVYWAAIQEYTATLKREAGDA